MKQLLALLVIFACAGCASLQSVSLTQIPAERRNRVQAEASRIIVLGINFDNDFVDEVRDDLRDRCPKGKVTGILTKDEVINYFLFIVYKRRVEATGYCQRS